MTRFRRNIDAAMHTWTIKATKRFDLNLLSVVDAALSGFRVGNQGLKRSIEPKRLNSETKCQITKICCFFGSFTLY